MDPAAYPGALPAHSARAAAASSTSPPPSCRSAAASSTSPRLGGLLSLLGEGPQPDLAAAPWHRHHRAHVDPAAVHAGWSTEAAAPSFPSQQPDRLPPPDDAAHHRRASCDSLAGARGCGRAAAVPLLPALGPAPVATSTQAPSAGFTRWLSSLDWMAEERLLHEARWRFCHYCDDAPLHEFRSWVCEASRHADEASVQAMWRAQLRAWLLCVSRRRRGGDRAGAAGPCEGIVLAEEVKHRIDCFVGGRLVWGVINAARAREVAESALRQIWRPESVMRAAALAAVASRFVHPAVVQAAEAGHMQCSTEIPTDDVALRALFEVTAAESRHEVGSLLSAHLALDGFEVEPKYHDPEYGLWRGFWVDKCNMVRLTLMW